MIAGGTSFYIHHSIFFRKWKNVISSSEFLTFLSLIVFSSLSVFYIFKHGFLTSFFHVTNAMTATGFSFLEMKNLAQALKTLLIFLMFIGGSSFSASGGIKIYRVLLLFKSLKYSLGKKLGEKISLELEGKEIDELEIILSPQLILLSLLAVLLSAYIFSMFGYDFINSLFESVSALSNVGLSVGIVNLGLNPFLKIILIILMGIGRVEISTFLFAIWRTNK